MKVSKKDYDEALARLHRFLKPKSKIYCTLRHVSSSGMSRRISFHAVSFDEKDVAGGYQPAIVNLDWMISQVLGYHQSDKGGLVVSGCGMDMGFSVVYNLGATLWPKGTPEPHGTRNGEPDSSGGYALTSAWL